jgi:hypothetical protein
MNTGAAEKVGAIERLTNSMAFHAAFGTAALVVVPVLLLGLVVSPLLLALDSPAAATPPLLLTAAGVAGVAGWLRAHWLVRAAPRGNLDVTLACLAIGVAAALVPSGLAGLLWVEWIEADRRFGPRPTLVTLVAAAHLVVAVSAIGWMQRLARHYARRTGERYDALPMVFLLLALALALVATLIAVSLTGDAW